MKSYLIARMFALRSHLGFSIPKHELSILTLFLLQSQLKPYSSMCVYSPLVLCSPTNVTATQSCGQTSVPVSWLASLGAVNYTAFAVSSTGQRTECSATGTSCIIQGSLHCGQVYTIAVVAVNDNCTSQESQSISLYTGNATQHIGRKLLFCI